jgi:hypothetical protein
VGRAAILGAAAAVILAAAAADADVLVNVPNTRLPCGGDIRTGVWYQSFSGGPHGATIQILFARKLVLWTKHVRATTTWRFWNYHPRCGRTYYARYSGPGWGAKPYTVRVRVAPAA